MVLLSVIGIYALFIIFTFQIINHYEQEMKCVMTLSRDVTEDAERKRTKSTCTWRTTRNMASVNVISVLRLFSFFPKFWLQNLKYYTYVQDASYYITMMGDLFAKNLETWCLKVTQAKRLKVFEVARVRKIEGIAADNFGWLGGAPKF